MAELHLAKKNSFSRYVDSNGYFIDEGKVYEVTLGIEIYKKISSRKSKLVILVTEDQARHLAEEKEFVLYRLAAVKDDNNTTFHCVVEGTIQRGEILVALIAKDAYKGDKNAIAKAIRNPIPLDNFAITIIPDIDNTSDEDLLLAIERWQHKIAKRVENAEKKRRAKAETQQPTEDSEEDSDNSSSTVTSLFDAAMDAEEDTQSSSSSASSFSKKKEYAEECFNLGMTKEEIAQKMNLPLSSVNILLS